jgi:hypothetical protein
MNKEENKDSEKPLKSKKGATFYSFFIASMSVVFMFLMGGAAAALKADNPMDYAICAGILILILLCATIRYNAK